MLLRSNSDLAVKRLAALCCLFGLTSAAWSDEVEPTNAPRCVHIEVFGRKGATNSDAATNFVNELAKQRDGIAVEIHDVSADPSAETRARQLLKQYQVARPGLPIIHACGQLVVGYKDAESTGRRIEDLLTIHAYVREGCPHCAGGKEFLKRIAKAYPGFSIQYHDIIAQPAERERLLELAKRHDVQVTNIPAFSLCGRLLVGYDTDDTSGRRILEVLQGACVPCPKELPAEEKTNGERKNTHRTESPFVPGVVLWGLPAMSLGSSIGATGTESTAEPDHDFPLEDLDSDESYAAPPKDSTNDEVDLPLFGSVRAGDLGLPLFTIAIGLVDGFNPCAMWVLLFLLSILVNLHDRLKILAVAGTFVMISGLAYFAFMAAWLNVFQIVGFFRPAQIVLGLLAVFIGSIHVKDFFAFHKGISLSIPEAAKPGIYSRVRHIVTAENIFGAIVGAAGLAVLVNVVELLCTAGLPALYTQILTLRGLPTWQEYAYLGLYNLAYMADDALMVSIVVITLGKRKMQETHGRWLKLISGLAVLILGLLLLFKPEWLV